MVKINVEAISETSFSVSVENAHPSVHQVSFRPEYAQQISQGLVDNMALVRASFAFLLDRESNTSILRSFDLSVIERYFPEYPTAIQAYFSQVLSE
jgi:hypothetical protein